MKRVYKGEDAIKMLPNVLLTNKAILIDNIVDHTDAKIGYLILLPGQQAILKNKNKINGKSLTANQSKTFNGSFIFVFTNESVCPSYIYNNICMGKYTDNSFILDREYEKVYNYGFIKLLENNIRSLR